MNLGLTLIFTNYSQILQAKINDNIKKQNQRIFFENKDKIMRNKL